MGLGVDPLFLPVSSVYVYLLSLIHTTILPWKLRVTGTYSQINVDKMRHREVRG